MKYDVLIIGGGPVGNYLASLLSGKMRVALVEAKGSFGGKACTGVIGAESYQLLNLPYEAIISELKGAIFYSKRVSFEISRPEVQAYVVDRKTLEKKLAIKAVEEGVNYFMGTRFLGFDGGTAVLKGPGGRYRIEADYYVGADGVKSKIAEEIGTRSEAEFLPGYEVEVIGSFREGFAEVWVDKELNQDFFLWLVPIGQTVARVGTIGDLDSLRKFLTVKSIRPTSTVEFKSGVLGIGWRKPWVKGNVALVGDAALQVKPTTGGGIVLGCLCASALSEALERGSLKLYWERCRDVRRQISIGLKIRRLFRGANQETLEKIFEILSREEARRIIEERADFDDHARTVKVLLKNPRVLREFLKISPYLIRSLL